MVFGEITTKAKVDYEAIVRATCKEIGFISKDVRDEHSLFFLLTAPFARSLTGWPGRQHL